MLRGKLRQFEGEQGRLSQPSEKWAAVFQRVINASAELHRESVAFCELMCDKEAVRKDPELTVQLGQWIGRLSFLKAELTP